MRESTRLAYLQALGVTQWVPRADYFTTQPEPTDPPWDDPDGSSGRVGADAVVVDAADDTVADVGVADRASPAAEYPSRFRDWQDLQQQVADCNLCALAQGRTRSVFGVGNRQADLMVIGEAPGYEEDRRGEPFVGRAGQLLNAMLLAIGLSRQAVFIANVVKCHPPNNRDPEKTEALACWPYLRQQLEWVAPRLILAVGRIAAQQLLQVETPVGKLRGQVHQIADLQIPLIVTYHPAYLLRAPAQKAKSWQDLIQVKKLLDGAGDAGR